MTNDTWKAFDGFLKTKYPEEYKQAQARLNAKLLSEVIIGAFRKVDECFKNMSDEDRQEILDIIEEQQRREEEEES